MSRYPETDIIIQFEQPGIRWSHTGGKTWCYSANSWNTIDWIIRHIVNKWAIYHVLDPELTVDEELCPACAAYCQVGIMKFHCFREGMELQTQIIYDSAGEPYTDDVGFYFRYRIEKCERCGHENSDYG